MSEYYIADMTTDVDVNSHFHPAHSTPFILSIKKCSSSDSLCRCRYCCYCCFCGYYCDCCCCCFCVIIVVFVVAGGGLSCFLRPRLPLANEILRNIEFKISREITLIFLTLLLTQTPLQMSLLWAPGWQPEIGMFKQEVKYGETLKAAMIFIN